MAQMIDVKVYVNKIEFRNLSTQQYFVALPDKPFTTQRLLVGEFEPFQECMRRGLAHVTQKYLGFMSASPQVVLQAMQMNEGGLSSIEKRILMEGAAGAGAKSVLISERGDLGDETLRKVNDQLC